MPFQKSEGTDANASRACLWVSCRALIGTVPKTFGRLGYIVFEQMQRWEGVAICLGRMSSSVKYIRHGVIFRPGVGVDLCR